MLLFCSCSVMVRMINLLLITSLKRNSNAVSAVSSRAERVHLKPIRTNFYECVDDRENSYQLYLLLWALHQLPLVALNLLQLIKLGSDVINGKLQEVPESSQVLRCGSGHGTGVLKRQWNTNCIVWTFVRLFVFKWIDLPFRLCEVSLQLEKQYKP